MPKDVCKPISMGPRTHIFGQAVSCSFFCFFLNFLHFPRHLVHFFSSIFVSCSIYSVASLALVHLGGQVLLHIVVSKPWYFDFMCVWVFIEMLI